MIEFSDRDLFRKRECPQLEFVEKIFSRKKPQTSFDILVDTGRRLSRNRKGASRTLAVNSKLDEFERVPAKQFVVISVAPNPL